MSATRPGQLLRRLAPPDPDDGPLLARFAADRDPATFAALVRRHGSVVLAVCRRVTGHPQDAEDAFQAVFLVLAKKAGQVRDPGRLGNWLYGVAVRVAGRARRSAARRRVREVQAVDPPDPAAPDDVAPADIGPALHEELAALPAHYREPIVLCDLQGATRAEAARALGVPEGTLSSRLANGRRKLAERLTRRGVVLTAVGVPAAVAEGRAAVPESLVQHTCGVVAAWAAGAAVPAAVVRLAAGGFPVKSVVLGGVLALSLVAGAVVAAGRPDPHPAPPPNPPVPPAVVEAAAPEPQDAGAQPEPKAANEPAAKAAGVGSPRLQEALDLPVRNGRRVVWSPTGDRLVAAYPPENSPGEEALLVVRTDDPKGPHLFGTTQGHGPDRFVGFTPDGKELLLARREHGLVSGRHRASFWVIGIVGRTGVPGVGGGEGVDGPRGGGPAAPPGAEGGGSFGPAGRALSLVPYSKEFAIDPDQTDDFAFAPDGKSYTTLLITRRDDLGIREVQFRRISTETGKIVGDEGLVRGAFRAFRLTADGKRYVHVHAQVEGSLKLGSVDDADEPRWSVAPEIMHVEGSGDAPLLESSRDGNRVLYGRGFSQLALLDGATGKALPALDGVGLVDAARARAAFSADGRLMALSYRPVEKKETIRKAAAPPETSFHPGQPRLAVWDTTTGRLVRMWTGQVTALAFHPTRPVLAVLEPNGAQTRLGLWDFSAE